MSRGGGSSSTTVVNTPAPRSQEEVLADQLRLKEMQRQNDLAEALLPNQRALIDQQRALIEYQMANQGKINDYQDSQLKLANLQIQGAIRDAAMQEQLAPMQLQFLQSQNALALQQIESSSKTMAFNDENNKYLLEQARDAHNRLVARQKAYSPEEEATAAAEEARRATRMGALSEEAANIQLEALKRNGKPTDEQAAFLNQAYDAAQKTGESDISRYLQETLRTITEQTANASGMRATDTPILRLSERAGEEAARAQGDLATDIAGKKAAAMVSAGMGLQQLQGAGAANLQSLAGTQAQAYNQVLSAQAAANRATAFSMPQSVGFAMPQQGGNANLSFMNPAGQVQLNPNSLGLQVGISHQGGTQQTNGRTSQWGVNFGDVAKAAAGVGQMIAMSDSRLKESIVPMGKTAGGATLHSYRYRGDNQVRVGVMAQEVRRIFPEAVVETPSGFLAVDYSKVK